MCNCPGGSVDKETGQQGRIFPRLMQFGNETSKNVFLTEMLQPYCYVYDWETLVERFSSWLIDYRVSAGCHFYRIFPAGSLQSICCYLDSSLNINSWVRAKLQESKRGSDSESSTRQIHYFSLRYDVLA